MHYLLVSKSFIAKNLRNNPVDSLGPIMGTLHLYTKAYFNSIISVKDCLMRYLNRITRGLPALGSRPWVTHGRGCGTQGLTLNIPDSFISQSRSQPSPGKKEVQPR